MIAFYNILDGIKAQLESDLYCNTVTYGDIFRVDLKKQSIFPLCHLIVNNATQEEGIMRFNVSVMAMDIVDISKEETTDTFRGNDNEQDVLNTQMGVLARLIQVIKMGRLTNDTYSLDGSADYEPFIERFENNLAGWVVSFDMVVAHDMTSCPIDVGGFNTYVGVDYVDDNYVD